MSRWVPIALLAICSALLAAACGSTSDATSVGDLRDCLKSGAADADLVVATKYPNVSEQVEQAGKGGVQLNAPEKSASDQAIGVAVETSERVARRTAKQSTANDLFAPEVAYSTGNVAVVAEETLTGAQKRLLDECGIGE